MTRNRLNVIGNSTTNLFTGSFGVQINQTLFNGFQTRNNVRAAEAQVNASDESLRNTEQNTMFNAASAYMDVIRDRQIAVLDERNLEFLSEQVRAALASHYQQDLDLQSLFKDVASAFVATAATLTEVPHLIDRAYRIAKAERRVTCVILPNDLQLMPMKQPPLAHGMTHSGVGIDLSPVTPAERELRKAADVLNSGEKVAMLVGAGALGATEELVAVADRLGAGVAKALLGKAALPDDLAFVTGSIGILGTKASWELMQGCDTLLMIGSGFPYAEFLPKPGKVRAVQIDRDAAMLGLRYPMEVNLVGDARATLRAILPMLAKQERRRVAPSDRDLDRRELAERAPGGRGKGGAGQSAAGRDGAVGPPAGPGDRHRRQRHHHGVVCAQPQVPRRHDGVGVGHAGHDGKCGALRHRRKVRLSG